MLLTKHSDDQNIAKRTERLFIAHILMNVYVQLFLFNNKISQVSVDLRFVNFIERLLIS